MKYLEDSRLTQLTTDLTGATLNTRGSGTGPTPIGLVRSTNTKNNSRGKGSKNKQQSGSNKQASSKRSSNNKKDSGASTPNYYAYNPVGYSSYNNNGKTTSTPSSCRVIYGRVEAYTTKRAGSDKQLAFEVGERYAHEMERLNEAVEALKRRHAEQHQLRVKEMGEENNDDALQESGGVVRSKKSERRARSRSLDGVTFDTTASSSLVYDKSTTTSEMMESNESTAPLSPLDEDKETITSHAKRTLPLEGILKEPTSNKRCRATSFDISTGPSAISSRPYHRNESSSSLLADSTWGSSSSSTRIHHPNDEDYNTRPIIPQPSLYQSSLEGDGDKKKKTGPTMVPRRLMTDLILTLNASFPDYDFGDAQTSDFCTLSTDEAMRRVNEKLGEFAATTDEGRDFLPRFWNALDDVLFHGLKDCEVYSYAPASGGDDPLEFLTTSMANETQVSNAASVQMAVANQDQPVVMFSPSGGGRIISGERLSSDGIDMSMLDVPRQISPAMDSSPHVTLWSMNYFFVSKNKKRIVLVACVETMRTPQGDADEDGSDGYDDEYENNLVFDEARREKAAKVEEDHLTSDDRVDFSSPSDVPYSQDTEDEHEIIDVDEDVCEDQDFDTGTMSAPTQMD